MRIVLKIQQSLQRDNKEPRPRVHASQLHRHDHLLGLPQQARRDQETRFGIEDPHQGEDRKRAEPAKTQGPSPQQRKIEHPC